MKTMKFLVALVFTPLVAVANLESEFANPPKSAKPQIWWHWITGNVSKEGITADLEAMQRVGLSEAHIFTIGGGAPLGPMQKMDPQFFDMVEFAAKEANRLGLNLSLHNCPGWSASGGPWIKPEEAMQFVTASEVVVTGPMLFNAKLPSPPSKAGFYKDIAVLAFPTPGDEEDVITPENPPTIMTTAPGVDTTPLMTGSGQVFVTFPAPEKGKPYYIQAEFKKPVSVRTLLFKVASGQSFGGDLMASDDGVTFRPLRRRVGLNPVDQAGYVHVSLGAEPVTAQIFRLNCEFSSGQAPVKISEIGFSCRASTPNLMLKAAYRNNHTIDVAQEMERDSRRKFSSSSAVRKSEMVNLTSALKEGGTLTWNVPKGKWTIIRFGHTPTGKVNGGPWQGLECNKLSPSGMEACWNGMMQPVLNRLDPSIKRTLVNSLIDSFEAGGQNWTAKMPEEFQKRRGYDPTLFLPAITGRVLESPAITERFLWDLRRTIADLFAENYYKPFTDLCHRNGLESMAETYGGPFEAMHCGGQVDIPMAEFWQDKDVSTVKMMSSVGHGYGKPVIAAESFTGAPEKHGCWKDDPYSMKAFGDQMFCWGINRFVFHSYAHQPWLNRFPGMTLGPYGINLNRANTWFEMAGPWMKYLSRCQLLLQQGRAVADVAYFCGQNSPFFWSRNNKPPIPQGYYFDNINADLLLHHARVVQGRIVLDGGASYAVLVLPASDPEMTPELLQKLRDMVRDGASILGSRPTHSPSLQGFPDCDSHVRALAEELWGNIDGKKITEHRLGKGRVVCGKDLKTVLADLQVAPDCRLSDGFEFIHRSFDHGDAFFVANSADKPIRQECSFRISGKIPELWHPDTGVMEEAQNYRVESDRVVVTVEFDPRGSVFVVFRKPAPPGAGVIERTRKSIAETAMEIPGGWKLNFPPNWGAPDSVNLDHLISWPEHPHPGVKYFSGTATYQKQVEIPASVFGKDRALWLDLGIVRNLAKVKLNGKELGILWKPPFRVDISTAAKSGENMLEVQVVNLWLNRLIGDEQLPEDGMPWRRSTPASWGRDLVGSVWPQWFIEGKPSPAGRLTFATHRHFTKESPLLPSGLLGPVRLILAELRLTTLHEEIIK